MKKKIKKKKKERICSTCFYYETIGTAAGECYRNPPVNDGNGETTTDRGGIVLYSRRACGEYK